MSFTELAEASTKSDKKYLILVEQTVGHWIAYDNLAILSSENKPMVSAEMMARALGYLYEEHTNTVKQFVLTKTTNVGNTYTIGKKYYTNKSGKAKTKIETKGPAAIDINNLYYCEASSLGKLCNYTYFSKDSIKDYTKVAGVDGVLCFSTVKNTKSLPNYKKVVTPYSQLWYKTFVDLKVGEPGKTELYGVTFTARDHLLESYEIKDDLDGKRSPVYQAMKDKALEYTTAYRKANNINTTISEYQLTVGGYCAFAYEKETHYFMHAISLNSITINNEDYWTINVVQHFGDNEADLNSLKALCYFISNTPETLYNVIVYDLFEYPVVPGIPGVRYGRVGEKWLSVIGREYGDFTISVKEDLSVDALSGGDGGLHPWLPSISGNSYYVKKAD
jgi:hypothetical protein